MQDNLVGLACPDCGHIVRIAFCLLANDGQQTAIMNVARCPRCFQRGDTRSVRSFQSLEGFDIRSAIENKLPLILLGGTGAPRTT